MNVKTLENGFKVFVEKKSGYAEKQAMIAVRFGSDISSFTADGKHYELPLGTAHFIEHKMFDSPRGGFMAKFAENNAEANAFTSFDITAYYFSCRENFYDNLSLLLEMISEPYFTEENIKSERSIIEKEINMYRDDLRWKCYFGLLSLMYENSPVGEFIAGTESEIANIKPEILYSCYNGFYIPQNMALVVAGDVEEEKIFETVSNFQAKNNRISLNSEAKIDSMNTIPEENYEAFAEADVKKPVFYCGLKYKPKKISAEDIIKTQLYLELIAGDCSSLYEDILSRGITEAPLTCEYLKGRYYNASFISGTANDPLAVKEILTERMTCFGEKELSLAIKKLKGRFLMMQDDLNSICSVLADCFVKNIDYLDICNLYDKMDNENYLSFDRPDSVFLSVAGGKR